MRAILTARSSALAAAALAALAGCRSPAPARDAVAPLLAVVREQERAWNDGSMEGFMAAGYWRSEAMTFLSGSDWTRGYETVLARYRRRYVEGDGRMGRLRFTELEALRLSRGVGLVRGRWTLTSEDRDELGGLFTLVMERRPEGWRVIHDHTSLEESGS